MKNNIPFQLLCRDRWFWRKKDRKSEKAEKIAEKIVEKICQKGLTDPEKFANINIHDLE